MSDNELISLLEAARAAVRDRIAPQLDGDERYQAMMVANALAIAVRRQQRHEDAEATELRGLRALFGDQSAGVAELRYRLANEIRAASLDRADDRTRAVWSHLLATAQGETAISNPRALGDG
jgi:hypothetical protein